MATSITTRFDFDPALLSSGTLWQPRAALTACLRVAMVRNTVGAALSDAQRINHFPASPMCSLGWWFTGKSLALKTPPDSTFDIQNTAPLPGQWVLAGPQTRPVSSWCPGPVHGMMVLFAPDALHLMTGIAPADLLDRFVDAAAVLPAEWLAMCQQVQDAPNDEQRLHILEEFLEPRWHAHRPPKPLQMNRYTDWATHLVQRAATSAPGRSLRQLERRIKRQAGLPLRELLVMGRSEEAFFTTVAAHSQGQNQGQTPGHYKSTLTWAQIAADSGYADQSHMNRVARRITGFSPEKLRDGIQREESFWAYRLWM